MQSPVISSSNARRNHLRLAAVRALASLLLACAAGTAVADQPVSCAAWAPEGAVAALTIHDGVARVGVLRESRVLASFLDSSAYEHLAATPGFLKAQGGMLLLAGSVGIEPWKIAAQVLGKEALLAIYPAPADAKPTVLLVVRVDDRAAASRIFDVVLNMSGATAGGQPAAGRSREVDGIRGYELNKEAFVALAGDYVLFCNRGEFLQRVIESRGKAAGKLDRSPGYLETSKAAQADAIATMFVDVASLRRQMGASWRTKMDNFVGSLLLGGVVGALETAESAAGSLAIEGDALVLRAETRGAAADAPASRVFRAGPSEARDWGRLELPELIGQISLSREWAEFWEQRERLLDAEGLRGLTEFANILTTIMGNLDFSTELLPELSPTMRLIAARQELSGDKPTPELPGLALVLQLKHPEKLAARLESAAMMAMSIINVDMGQKMQPQYQMSMETHGGTRMVVARFPESAEPGLRGVRYNFEPCVCTVADRFIVCTSRRMMERIIDAQARLPEAGAAASRPACGDDVLTLDLAAVVRLLDANRPLLVKNRMLEEDLPEAQAAADVGMFLDIAQALRRLTIRIGPATGGLALSARLEYGEMGRAP